MCSVGKNFALALMALLCPLVTSAQLTAFKSQFNEATYYKAVQLLGNDSFSDTKTNVLYGLEDVEQIFQTNFQNVDSLQLMWFENQKSLIKKDLGLNALGSFGMNERFLEDGGESSFGMRMRAGVEWNLLENGMGSRKNELRKLAKEQEIFFLESKLDEKERNYPHLYNNLIYAFNEEKIFLLDQRIWFLQGLVDVLYDLYHNHDLSYTELIDYKTKLEESKVLRKAFERFNGAFAQAMDDEILEVNASQLPLLEIDLEVLLNDTVFQNMQEELAVAKKELIDLKHDPTNNVNLRVAAHYNYRSNTLNNTYPSFNTTVRMPLRFDKAERQRAEELEMEMLDEDMNYVFYNNARELMNLYQEYNYKLKQFVEFRHKTARLNEQARLEYVLLKDERLAHSPMRALAIKENQVAVQIELLDIKQQMYIRLLKMYAKTYHQNFTDCLYPINLKSVDKKLPGERFVYLSEHDFADLNKNFLIAYLEKNEMHNVLLPLSIAKDINLVKNLRNRGIKVITEGFVPKYASALQREFFDGFYIAGYEGNEKFFYLNAEYLNAENQSTSHLKLNNVPLNRFSSRVEMESWIFAQTEKETNPLFLIKNIGQLIKLEKQNLSLTEEN